jgi:hypothetical protein
MTSLRPGRRVHDLLALAGLGDRARRRGDEAAAVDEASSSLPLVAGHQSDDIPLALDVDHQPDRLAEAAPPGSLSAAERVEAAVGGGQQDLVRRLGVEDEGRGSRLP